MLPCNWKTDFGIECPTCGFQRSFIELIHGHVGESIKLFPATIPFLITLVILIFHLRFKWKHGARFIVWSFAASAFLIASNYFLKLVELL